MFGKQAHELLQEVAQCPAENLPAFNVSGGSGLLNACCLAPLLMPAPAIRQCPLPHTGFPGNVLCRRRIFFVV